MVQRQPGGAIPDVPESPPEDTGEALDLPASGLTITIGFGPGMFVAPDGTDRFGLAGSKPEALQDLPPFFLDTLRPEISGGDICIQACAHNPQVAVHAVRNLVRIGFGVVSVKWSQLGFGRTSSTTSGRATPRNLLGLKDGTNNLQTVSDEDRDKQIWVQPGDGPDWHTGGSYVVTRRIAMIIEVWDRTSLVEQEQIIGRTKLEGSPLGEGKEFDPVDLTASSIPEVAHIRLANPEVDGGAAMLRRGHSFVDGSTELGRLDAGLFFIAYQRDPRTGFIPVQRNLRADILNEYIRHTSSAVFACPPGVQDADDYWGPCPVHLRASTGRYAHNVQDLAPFPGRYAHNVRGAWSWHSCVRAPDRGIGYARRTDGLTTLAGAVPLSWFLRTWPDLGHSRGQDELLAQRVPLEAIRQQ